MFQVTLLAMHLWLLARPIQAAMSEAGQAVSPTPIRQRHWRYVRAESQTRRSSHSPRRSSRRLGLGHMLAAVLVLVGHAPSARAQSSVTLAWDPSVGGGIAGYRLYQGASSRSYTNVITTGNATTATVSNLVRGATYFFAVTAYSTNGLESEYSNEITYTVSNTPPAISLSSPANGTVYTAPATIGLAANVTANGHTISQVQFYNGATLLGTDASAPYSFSWNSVSAGTYSLSAKLIYDSGSTVASGVANVTVAAARPPSGLTFAADSGLISAPFLATNGTVFQPMETTITASGEATYTFNIVNAGNYVVSAVVKAPNDGQNSLFVNIDAEPTDPLMIWDIPVGAGFINRTVSWRGNGSWLPETAQYNPKVFALSAGTHQLIIRGREADTTLASISITPTPPKLQIRTRPGGSIVLSLTGQPNQTYSVMGSLDLKAWTFVGTATLNSNGSGQYTDLAANSRRTWFYRLLGQ